MAIDDEARGMAGSALGIVRKVSPTGANDHTTINAAITAVNAAGGGIVQLVAGTYDIADNVSMASNVVLQGVGYATHLMLKASTVKNVIQSVSATNIAIKDLRVDGNRANNTDPGTSADNVQNGICAWGCDGIEISGVWAHGAIFHGIFIRDSANNTNINIHHNYLYLNGYRACHIHGNDTYSNTHAMVTNNIVWENGQEAGSQTTGNSGIFAIFENAKYVSVSDNIIHGETGYGIEVGGVFGTTVAIERCLVSGNIVSGAGWSGIRVTNSIKNLAVVNNIVAGSANHGILLTNVESSKVNELISITGNQTVGNTESGIHISGATGSVTKDILISQNISSGNGNCGVNFANSSTYFSVSIFANLLSGNASRGLQLAKGAAFTVGDLCIVANQFRLNGTGAIDIDGLAGFVMVGNVMRDNTVASGSNTSVSITACSKGVIANNRIAHSELTATGSGIYIGDTSSDLLLDSNLINVGGAGIFCQGSGIHIERTRGSSQLNLGSLSDNCILTDNRNTNSPYYADSGTGNIARRVILSAPATAASSGVKGDEAYDSSGNHFKCTAANTWVKAAYATF